MKTRLKLDNYMNRRFHSPLMVGPPGFEPGYLPCEGSVLDQTERQAQFNRNMMYMIVVLNYFFTPRDLFLSLKSWALHFLHLLELIGFLAPHLRQILAKSRFFCAICFLTASVIGKLTNILVKMLTLLLYLFI